MALQCGRFEKNISACVGVLQRVGDVHFGHFLLFCLFVTGGRKRLVRGAKVAKVFVVIVVVVIIVVIIVVVIIIEVVIAVAVG